MGEPAILSEHGEGVAWVTINRPERRNAIDTATRGLLADAFAAAEADADVRVVVLRGAGGAFCSGVDLKDATAPQGHVLERAPRPLAAPVAACDKVVVAAVDGAAIGGGFELALAADCRVASEAAVFALTEAHIGSMPGSGGTQRLFQAVPSAVAWKLLFTGARLDARRAYEVGLVSDLFPAGQFDDGVRDLALQIAAAAPLSLQAIKRAGTAALAGAGAAGHDLERSLWAFLSTTDDREEGRAAFRERRDPDFRGR